MSIFDTSLLRLASAAHGSVWDDMQGYRDAYQKQLTAAGKEPVPGAGMFSNIGGGLAEALPGMMEGLGGLLGIGGGSQPISAMGQQAFNAMPWDMFGSSGPQQSNWFGNVMGGMGGMGGMQMPAQAGSFAASGLPGLAGTNLPF